MKNTLLLALFSPLILATAFAEKTVAVYDLHGFIPENGVSNPSPFELMGDPKRPITHYDLVDSLNYAISDEDVEAIVVDIDDAAVGFAQVQEIRRLLLLARKQKKDVWLFSQHYSLATALLGSAANHFTITPESGSSFLGFYSESMYFKGMLDKIGVKMDVVHIGDFKSAGEQFYLSKPSKHQIKQTTALFDSLYAQITEQIAEGRGIEKKDVIKIINQGIVNTTQLKEAKLVDAVEYKTDLIKKLRKKYKGAKFDRSYELPYTGPPKIDGMMDFFKLLSGKQQKRNLSRPYVAIIPLEGAITDASIAPVREEILKVTKDPKCKGLVLRVNSPGGSALASEVLWEATEEFKNTDRPFVVSMGGVAASGGYYVSASADTIFAEPGTITGSIGVVSMKPVIGEALKKLGISTYFTKRGQHAGIHNSSRAYSDNERELLKKSMLEVYATFKQRITDGRGDKIKGELETHAGGRVYTGQDALEIGLVDQLGGLNDAIYHVIEQCKEETLYTHLFPEPKNPMELLFQPPTREQKDEFIQTQKTTKMNQLSSLLFQNDVLNLLGEQKKHQLKTFMQQIESTQEHHIQLIAPIGLQIQTN